MGLSQCHTLYHSCLSFSQHLTSNHGLCHCGFFLASPVLLIHFHCCKLTMATLIAPNSQLHLRHMIVAVTDGCDYYDNSHTVVIGLLYRINLEDTDNHKVSLQPWGLWFCNLVDGGGYGDAVGDVNTGTRCCVFVESEASFRSWNYSWQQNSIAWFVFMLYCCCGDVSVVQVIDPSLLFTVMHDRELRLSKLLLWSRKSPINTVWRCEHPGLRLGLPDVLVGLLVLVH